MKKAGTGVITLLLLTASFGPSLVVANEAPLADAGLDQQVTRGSTVLLDATGSRDPDGRIERYEWVIKTPTGRTVTPDCSDCARTRFEPGAVGTYTVTVTVTDDDGATSSDTLYVTVSPGESPKLDLDGPNDTTVGKQTSYSATIDAGTASLEYVVWSVDGTEAVNRTLSGRHGADTLVRTFPTAGTKTITVTVVDADGQRTTETLSVTAHVPQNPDPPSDTRSISERHDPTVSGDTLVTGTTPLRGTYHVSLAGATGSVRTIKWMADSRLFGSGQSANKTWKPGDHTLYAVVTYSDGSTDVARFDDGSTKVVADPQPTASLSGLNEIDAISGTGVGTDAYGNLLSVTVKIDGSIVGVSEMDFRGANPSQRQEARFTHRDFEPGETYNLTIVSVDDRGQRSTTTKTIEPVKRPEVVEAGFVNGPVDSYHERIDPDRYTAHHVMKVDLNGVDASKVSSSYLVKSPQVRKLSSDKEFGDDEVIFHTYWAGNTPGEYSIIPKLEVSGSISIQHNLREQSSSFKVTPSPPELRFDVIAPGAHTRYPTQWGMVVDASKSFDPDGPEISYIWKGGSRPLPSNDAIAKFSSVRFVTIGVKDDDGLISTKKFNFLSHYVPSVTNPVVKTNGPYNPDEKVTVSIATEPYRFSKNRYHLDFELEASVTSSDGEVIKWKKRRVDNDSSSPSDDHRQYVGTVKIPASELAKDTQNPEVRVFSVEHSDTEERISLPDVRVLRRYGQVWKNVSVENVKYLVERPKYDWVTVRSTSDRDKYLNEGYSVTDKEQEGFRYTVEERVKVRDAKFRQLRKTFSSRWERSAFVQNFPSWSVAGTDVTTKTKTVTKSEWRDSKTGRGRFTGETRRVKTQHAKYRTLKQYAYSYNVQKTSTRTVTKTRTVIRCPRRYLCYEDTSTYTTTETYTYTVTRTETYWAYRKMGRDHWSTGEYRQEKVRDAEYETQYRFEYSTEETEVVRRYIAERRKKIRDAKYEWRTKITTKDRLLTESYLSSDNYRIGSAEPVTSWTLSKLDGNRTIWVSDYQESDTFIRTSATVSGDVKKKFIYVGEDRSKLVDVGHRRVDVSLFRKASEEDLRKEAVSAEEENDGDCRIGDNCINNRKILYDII
ncbi:hypothetical protein DMJ13_15960 [halophilic archaeon]|nr:hypothetical protein DMJ13_15960 [halophilic archaeon]